MNNNRFYSIMITILICLSTANLYLIYNLHKKLDNDTLVLSNSINTLTLDTKGKIDNLEVKTNEKLSKVKNTVVEHKEIVYTEKTSQNDADIELKNAPSFLTVKVNDGTKYTMNLLPNEKHKFEDGKLIINQGFSSDINIKAYEPRRSQWSISTAMNSDKKVLGGIHYNLTDSLSASVYAGQDIKPYYGFTYRIGGNK